MAGLGVAAEADVQPRTIRTRGLVGSIRRMPPRQLAIAAALGLGAGVIGEITGGLTGMAGGTTAGLITGLALGLPQIIGRPADPAASPASSIRRDRLVALTAGLAGTALGGLLGYHRHHPAAADRPGIHRRRGTRPGHRPRGNKAERIGLPVPARTAPGPPRQPPVKRSRGKTHPLMHQ